MPVKASIVIRTLNEAEHLGQLLEGIHEQNFKDWEIVLVDSGSSDGTLEIAERYGCNIYHIPQKEFTFGRSLNIGCEKASGEFLVFASGHVWPVTNNWLGNLVEPFNDPAVAMVYGRQRGTDKSRLSEIRDLSVDFGPASTVLVDEAKGNNGNAAIRRGLWLEQPFDESLPGLEDVDWARKVVRNDYRVYYAADAPVYHYHDETLRQVYRRSLREAIAVKRMFPFYRYTLSDMVKGLPYFILRDTLFGLKTGRRRKLIHVPATRFAHLLGIYNGVRFHKGQASELKNRLEIPRSTTSVVVNEDGSHGLENLDLPEVGVGEVVVQVAFAGVCTSDVRLISDPQAGAVVGHSTIPGHEFSGMVVKTGPNVRGLALGEKVAGVSMDYGKYGIASSEVSGPFPKLTKSTTNPAGGSYAKYLVRSEKLLRRLPWDVPLSYGALTETLALCVGAIRRLEIKQGSMACVVGAGPVGNLCVQILNAMGLRVVAVDPNPRWLTFLQKYDVDTLTELGPMDRYSHIIETTGVLETLTSLIQNSNPTAKILRLNEGCETVYPVEDGLSEYDDKLILSPAHPQPADWRQAMNLVSKGAIRLDDHAATVEPLESYESAWDGLSSGRHFKVLLNASKELGSL